MQRVRWIAGLVGIILSSLTLVQQQAQPQTVDSAQAVAEVDSLTAQLSPLQADRCAHWLALGVRFEGAWEAEQMAALLPVLDRFADGLGEERFLTLIRQVVAARSNGQVERLTFAVAPSHDGWAASWAPEMGQITLYGSLFDQAFMDTHYRWRFQDDLAEAQPRAVTTQEFTIGHELGHLIVDALREEHVARHLAPTLLETTYAESVYRDFWANPMQEANESVASEVALWVYGIRRPRQVQAYRERILGPAMEGETDMVVSSLGE